MAMNKDWQINFDVEEVPGRGRTQVLRVSGMLASQADYDRFISCLEICKPILSRYRKAVAADFGIEECKIREGERTIKASRFRKRLSEAL